MPALHLSVGAHALLRAAWPYCTLVHTIYLRELVQQLARVRVEIHVRLRTARGKRNPEENGALLVAWGKLHAVRSTLSLVASIIFIGALASA